MVGSEGVQFTNQPLCQNQPPSVAFPAFELNAIIAIISLILLTVTLLGIPLSGPTIGSGHPERPRAL